MTAVNINGSFSVVLPLAWFDQFPVFEYFVFAPDASFGGFSRQFQNSIDLQLPP